MNQEDVFYKMAEKMDLSKAIEEVATEYWKLGGLFVRERHPDYDELYPTEETKQYDWSQMAEVYEEVKREAIEQQRAMIVRFSRSPNVIRFLEEFVEEEIIP